MGEQRHPVRLDRWPALDSNHSTSLRRPRTPRALRCPHSAGVFNMLLSWLKLAACGGAWPIADCNPKRLCPIFTSSGRSRVFSRVRVLAILTAPPSPRPPPSWSGPRHRHWKGVKAVWRFGQGRAALEGLRSHTHRTARTHTGIPGPRGVRFDHAVSALWSAMGMEVCVALEFWIKAGGFY